MSSTTHDKLNELRGVTLEKAMLKKDGQTLDEETIIQEVENDGLAMANQDSLLELTRDNETTTVTCPDHKNRPTLFLCFIGIIILALLCGGYVFFQQNNATDNSGICKTRCCDGTCSPSEGRGTCSFHGGVYGVSCNKE